MRLKRLIQKKSKKFLINRLRNNFSTIFQSYNISDKKFCNIPYVDLKFFKDSILTKKNETLRVKIDGQILPKLLVTGKFDEFLFKFLKKKLKKKTLFIDVGSNHGFISKQVSTIRLVKKIITYEPFPELFNIAKKNLTNVKNIKQINYGWAKKKGNYPFYENISNSGDLSLIKNRQRNVKHVCKFLNANNEISKIISSNKNLLIVLKTDCQGYDVDIFCNIDDSNLKKINIYFLECKDISENNKINFYKKVKLFKKIMVSCPLLHENIKDIGIEDIKYYLDYKVEFDLIFLN